MSTGVAVQGTGIGAGYTRDIGFAVGIIVILTVLFLPLPAIMIDVGLAFSIAFAVLILMVSLWIPLPIWMGVRDWPAYGALVGMLVACAGITAYYLWRGKDRDERLPLVHLAITSVTVMLSSEFVGPLVLVPALALGNQVAYLSIYSHRRWIVIAASVLSIAVPIAASALGWIPPFYEARDGALTILPGVFSFPYVLTIVFLVATQAGILVVAGILFIRQRNAYVAAATALELQSWQLEQILPRTARAETG